MDDATRHLFEQVDETLRVLEREVGLPERFLGDLLAKDDDWFLGAVYH